MVTYLVFMVEILLLRSPGLLCSWQLAMVGVMGNLKMMHKVISPLDFPMRSPRQVSYLKAQPAIRMSSAFVLPADLPGVPPKIPPALTGAVEQLEAAVAGGQLEKVAEVMTQQCTELQTAQQNYPSLHTRLRTCSDNVGSLIQRKGTPDFYIAVFSGGLPDGVSKRNVGE